LRLLLVNTFDVGGAAQACMRLHFGLNDFKGINSNLLLCKKSKDISNSFLCSKRNDPHLSTNEKFIIKFKRICRELKLLPPLEKVVDEKVEFLNKRPQGLEYFSFPSSNYDITSNPLYHEADIIHLHWVADFLDWPSFFAKNTKPIVWTLHDQNPFLGGQHYNERFLGIDEAGMPIPRKMNGTELQKEKELIELKMNAIQRVTNLCVVSPSKWLLNESKASSILNKFNHRLIQYGVPTDVFKKLDKSFCRQVLGLPKDKTIILFVADTVTNSRKGYAFLQKAIQEIHELGNGQVISCAVGNKNELNQNQDFFELGKIQDERLMAVAYSAADLFVIPSLEDNLPNTMLESLCCGTPILGFPTGGILDVIQDGENGILCEEISVNSLVKGLNKFLSGEVVFNRESISRRASERFSLEKQANAYIELYKEIMTQNV
jgi:glycosyltransferase involved in cell wall biosynthesis